MWLILDYDWLRRWAVAFGCAKRLMRTGTQRVLPGCESDMSWRIRAAPDPARRIADSQPRSPVPATVTPPQWRSAE